MAGSYIFDPIPNFSGISTLLLLSKLITGKPKHYQVSELWVQCIQTMVVMGQTSVGCYIGDEDNLSFVVRKADITLAPKIGHRKIVNGFWVIMVDIAGFEWYSNDFTKLSNSHHNQEP